MQEQIKQRLENIISTMTQLPSIPDVVSRIINMVNDPNVDFKAVAEEIAKDQSLTTNILKLCNSAYFSKGKEIVSVDRAIVTLGLKEIKDIVVLVTCRNVLDKPILGYDLAAGEMWTHNLTVAILAKKMSMDIKRKDLADIVFTGGIIHDVGKTVLALYVANTFKDIMKVTQEKAVTFIDAEKDVMGFNHQDIGLKILEKWKFPDSLKAVVAYHHNPENSPKEFYKAVSIVHVANIITLMAGVGIGGDGLYHALNPDAVKETGISDADLEKYYSIVPEIVKQAKQI